MHCGVYGILGNVTYMARLSIQLLQHYVTGPEPYSVDANELTHHASCVMHVISDPGAKCMARLIRCRMHIAYQFPQVLP